MMPDLVQLQVLDSLLREVSLTRTAERRHEGSDFLAIM